MFAPLSFKVLKHRGQDCMVSLQERCSIPLQKCNLGAGLRDRNIDRKTIETSSHLEREQLKVRTVSVLVSDPSTPNMTRRNIASSTTSYPIQQEQGFLKISGSISCVKPLDLLTTQVCPMHTFFSLGISIGAGIY